MSDHDWIAVVHAPDPAFGIRVSLHRRRKGRNYHISLVFPPGIAHVIRQRADRIAEELNHDGAVGGQEFVGSDLLTFPGAVW